MIEMTLEEILREKVRKFSETSPKWLFEPLQITFSLSSPMLLTYPWIHFDGIISHLMAQEIFQEYYSLLPTRQPIPFNAYLPVPLEKEHFVVDDQQVFFYRASVSIVSDENAITSETVYKRFDDRFTENLQTKKRKIRVDGGIYRSFAIKFAGNYSPEVTFFAKGDKKQLSSLLSELFYLGKKSSYGYGRIQDYSIISVDEDYSFIKNSKTTKPLPANYVLQHLNLLPSEYAFLSYRPPYWEKQNHTYCVPPFTEVVSNE
jgi:CRISPR type IV-associated protein Csf3